MNTALNCLIAICCQLNDGAAPASPKEEWSHVVLWKSDVLSARLLFQPAVSIASQTWFVLELDNHTQRPIELGQTWISLTSVAKDDRDATSRCGMSVSGTMRSIAMVPPGRHRYDGDTLRFAPSNAHCSGDKVRVEVLAKISTETTGGRSFETAEGTTFFFEWRQPTDKQLALMCDEVKKRLGAGALLYDDYARITTLLSESTVVQSLKVDDFLSALKATRDWNLRYILLPHLFAQHAEDPKVLEYYREMFKKDPDFIYQDFNIPSVWNEEFLEPLVKGCEKEKWGYFWALSRHVPSWRNNQPAVSRVSAALLVHHAVLRRDVRKIEDNDLEKWAMAALAASSVPDPQLVKLLQPALDDHRNANIDLGSGGINEARVCDRALIAILSILDGDSWTSFKAAGITGWKTKAEQQSAHDRVIEILKTRLKAEPSR